MSSAFDDNDYGEVLFSSENGLRLIELCELLGHDWYHLDRERRERNWPGLGG